MRNVCHRLAPHGGASRDSVYDTNLAVERVGVITHSRQRVAGRSRTYFYYSQQIHRPSSVVCGETGAPPPLISALPSATSAGALEIGKEPQNRPPFSGSAHPCHRHLSIHMLHTPVSHNRIRYRIRVPSHNYPSCTNVTYANVAWRPRQRRLTFHASLSAESQNRCPFLTVCRRYFSFLCCPLFFLTSITSSYRFLYENGTVPHPSQILRLPSQRYVPGPVSPPSTPILGSHVVAPAC